MTIKLFCIILMGSSMMGPFGSNKASATTYTWIGNVSSSWSSPLNWNPSTGYPSAADNVLINSDAIYPPKLNESVTINDLTFSTSGFDLAGFTLTVNGTAMLESGVIGNGILMFLGSTTFAGTTITNGTTKTASKISEFGVFALASNRVVTAVADEHDKRIAIYPNPSNGIFIMKGFSDVNYTISIYNIMRQLVYTKDQMASEINLTRQPDGVYFIHVFTSNKRKIISRFVKSTVNR